MSICCGGVVEWLLILVFCFCIIDKDELKDGLCVFIFMDDKLLYVGYV